MVAVLILRGEPVVLQTLESLVAALQLGCYDARQRFQIKSRLLHVFRDSLVQTLCVGIASNARATSVHTLGFHNNACHSKVQIPHLFVRLEEPKVQLAYLARHRQRYPLLRHCVVRGHIDR